MSQPRTFQVATVDRGLLNVTEPAWCTGDHETEGRIYAGEIHHIGPPVSITVTAGGRPVQILELRLWQDPYPTPTYEHGAEVYVNVYIGAGNLDTIDYGLDALTELSVG